VYANASLFRGRTVMELGAGCGLVGLVCAHFASRLYLTDRLPLVSSSSSSSTSFSSFSERRHRQRHQWLRRLDVCTSSDREF
jgi:tRNA1(Val) A37 N6-methylase TrmN6